MRRKYLGVTLVSLFFLILSSIAVSWAAPFPSQLIVVRASDNSLWKATCTGSVCTAFTNFPGSLASQPTVVWDEILRHYVLWGRASNNTIWRSTFNGSGVFQNDWTSIPGLTSSPLGATGSNFKFPLGDFAAADVRDVSTISTDCNNMTNLTSVSTTPPSDAFSIYFWTDGIYAPGLANKWVRVCLSTTSGGAASTCNSWGPVIESDTVGPQFEGERRYALRMSLGIALANTTYTVYLKACRESGATGNLLWDELQTITAQ